MPINYKFELCGQEYPVDISGYVVQMEVRATANSENPPLIDISSIEGHILIDGPNGKIEVWIPNSLTSTLPLGCFVYDIKVTNSTALIERLIGGTFTVKEMVTK